MTSSVFYLSMFSLSIIGSLAGFFQYRKATGVSKTFLVALLTYFIASIIYVLFYWAGVVEPIAEWRLLLILKCIVVLFLCVKTVHNLVDYIKHLGDKQSDNYYNELKKYYGIK